jgi:hypothetical protein
MHATTVAIDLAKDVFELAFADADHRILERKRLSRRTFAHVLDNRVPLRVVMEACGSAHYWARRFVGQGHTVCLLPARDVRPYVRRNKTDRTDVAGILEADRCAQIDPVPIKSPEQQGVQALHRIRERLKSQRTSTINLLRGVLREFGLVIHPWSARRPACGAGSAAKGSIARPSAGMGTSVAGPARPQQGGGRANQQDGPTRVGHGTSSRRFRQQSLQRAAYCRHRRGVYHRVTVLLSPSCQGDLCHGECVGPESNQADNSSGLRGRSERLAFDSRIP